MWCLWSNIFLLISKLALPCEIQVVHGISHRFENNSVLPKTIHSIPSLVGEQTLEKNIEIAQIDILLPIFYVSCNLYRIRKPVSLETILGLASPKGGLAHWSFFSLEHCRCAWDFQWGLLEMRFDQNILKILNSERKEPRCWSKLPTSKVK